MTTPIGSNQQQTPTTRSRFHLHPKVGRFLRLAPIVFALLFATVLSISPHTATGADAATGAVLLQGTTTYARSSVGLQQWNGSKWVTVANTTSNSSRNFAFYVPRGAYYRVTAAINLTPTGNYCPSYAYYGATNYFIFNAYSTSTASINVNMTYWGQVC